MESPAAILNTRPEVACPKELKDKRVVLSYIKPTVATLILNDSTQT